MTNIASVNVEDGVVEHLGYDQSYRRVLRSVGSIALVLALASPMAAILINSFYQIIYGGHWGLTWGWVIACVFLFPQALTVAELCSSMPTNGAFYWYTAALAPPRFSKPLSFIAGWITTLSLFTSLASFAFACASSYAVLIPVMVPTWTPTNPQMLAMALAILALWALLNMLRFEKIAMVMVAISGVVLATTAIFIVALPASQAAQNISFASGYTALLKYENFSEWSRAVAVPFTFFTAFWSVTGWQSPCYVVEGIQNARTTAPRAIIISFSAMATMGTIVCLICSFCLTDIEAAATDPSGFPLFTLILNLWGVKLGFTFLIIIVSTTIFGGSSLLFSSACQIAAFARDGGLPYPHLFSYVHPGTSMPLYSTLLLVIGTVLALLFSLSPVAGPIIYSLAVIMNVLVYLLPIGLRLVAPKERYTPGPWNLGRMSWPVAFCGFVTGCWLIVMETFPTTPNWTVASFNYNWVVSLATMGIAALLWVCIGGNYKGINLEALRGMQLNIDTEGVK
ncbi:amino acid transporter [Aaosphaeria arxii CBS 175.79]|uniref:Amino acid transporter n=1 Tax=Aaosphaeria arxii CBS 175.79 TaxID=1450172 RepID=A0A6A5X7X6_9PLEO|nr:amino acid transporter [Aaosphaeria arxii CBS 175.79]KAF2009030.1 amino acid transporter [Aaosphaeria arxii CBS 175.79]